MNPRINKEIRLLAPGMLAGVVLMVAANFGERGMMPVFLLIGFSIGCVMLGVSSIGTELAYATISSQLAMPIDRRRLWNERVLVMSGGLVLLSIGYAILLQASLAGPGPQHVYVSYCALAGMATPFLAATIGPLSCLKYRDIRTAITITFGGTTGVSWLGWIVWDGDPGWRSGSSLVAALLMVVFILHRRGRHAFVRYQDHQPITHDPESLPYSSSTVSQRRTHLRPLVALAKRELRLQQANLKVGVILTVVFMGSTSALGLSHLATALLLFLVPALLGAASVAAEHQLGTHTQLLVLPMRKTSLWCVKFAVSWIFAASLVLVVQSINEPLRFGLSIYTNPVGHIGTCLLLAAVPVAFGMAASSLSRSYLESVGILVVLSSLPLFVGVVAPSLIPHHPFVPPQKLFVYVGVTLVVFSVILVGFVAFRTDESAFSKWRLMAKIAGGTGAVALLACSAVYLRAWELLLTQPKDATPILSTAHRGILADILKSHCLGPDGRIYQRVADDPLGRGSADPIGFESLTSPLRAISPETNWVQIASGTGFVTALKSDGTLWRTGSQHYERFKQLRPGWPIARPDYPSVLTQFGTESNWQSISVFWHRYAALKRDGSLWQWGGFRPSYFGLSDTNGAQVISEPVRVGTNNHWQQVMLGFTHSLVLRSDGQLHHWGNLPPENPKSPDFVLRDKPVPVARFAYLRVAKILTPFLVRLTDGNIAVVPDRGTVELNSFPNVFRTHPNHSRIVIAPEIATSYEFLRSAYVLPKAISASGELLEMHPDNPPLKWNRLSKTDTWLAQATYYSRHYYLKTDGSVWRSDTMIDPWGPQPHSKAPLAHWSQQHLIPPRFRLHRLGFLFPQNH